MSKTRNQRKRQREETYFYLAVAAWVVALVILLTVKAV